MTQSSNAIPVSDDDDASLATALRKFNIGSVQRLDEIIVELQTLRATKGELVEALRPFAAYAWSLRSRQDGDHEIGWMGLNEHGEHAAVDIAVRDFRAARTALSRSGVSKI